MAEECTQAARPYVGRHVLNRMKSSTFDGHGRNKLLELFRCVSRGLPVLDVRRKWNNLEMLHFLVLNKWTRERTPQWR